MIFPFSPIVAFGFANLALLGWLGAAAAPILIHLWMRQSHRETVWAAVRFLQAALERQARRLRLQHWVLLAIRTAILLLVVFAAAKPFLDNGPLGAGASVQRVLVLDASLSMSALGESGEPRLETAKRLADRLVADSGLGDSHSLVVMGAKATSPIGRPLADQDAVRRAIATVEPSSGVADLAGALATAERVLNAADDASRPKRREVILFSDLGANSWGPLGERSAGDAPASGAAELYRRLSETASVAVVDVGGAPGPSAAVTRLAPANDLATLAEATELRLEATLNSAQGGATQERIAQLLVDGAVVAEQPATLRAGESTAIDFVHRFADPGVATVAVRLTGEGEGADALPHDDTRWLALRMRERVRVLCVAGSRGSAVYLADALNPSGADDGPFEPVVVSDADLATIALADFDCVFFANVPELSGREAGRLRRYVADGGGVVFFLGDRVDAARYNEVLGPGGGQSLGATRPDGPFRTVSVLLAQTGNVAEGDSPEKENQEAEGPLLPVLLGEAVSRPSYRVDPLGYEHPIAAPFRGRERAGLLTTPVGRYFQLGLPGADGPRVSVALALENGDPLLVTAQLGRGRTAVVATAGSLSSVDPATGEPWTALPAWPSFLPIVRELVRFVASSSAAEGDLTVGDPLRGPLLGGPGGAAPEITLPSGERAAPTSTDSTEWAFDGTLRPGVYRYGPPGGEAFGAMAVNTDPAEGDLRRVGLDLLPGSLQISPGLETRNGESGATLNEPAPIHRWLLHAALALLLVESALACWFGRGSL